MLTLLPAAIADLVQEGFRLRTGFGNTAQANRTGVAPEHRKFLDTTNFKFYFDFVETVSMLQMRRDAASVIEKLKKGIRLKLTYCGKPLAVLTPVGEKDGPDSEDPFYNICDLAQSGGGKLSNDEIDEILYID